MVVHKGSGHFARARSWVGGEAGSSTGRRRLLSRLQLPPHGIFDEREEAFTGLQLRALRVKSVFGDRAGRSDPPRCASLSRSRRGRRPLSGAVPDRPSRLDSLDSLDSVVACRACHCCPGRCVSHRPHTHIYIYSVYIKRKVYIYIVYIFS